MAFCLSKLVRFQIDRRLLEIEARKFDRLLRAYSPKQKRGTHAWSTLLTLIIFIFMKFYSRVARAQRNKN